MNAETKMVPESPTYAAVYSDLVKPGLSRLSPLMKRSRDLQIALDGLAEIGDKSTARSARVLKQKLLALEPSVTMIGQVKAGKTSLVNAMVGWPDLLPADVNPWTSVVTSLHMNPKSKTSDNCASFTPPR